MKIAISKVGFSGLATLIALFISVGMILIATNQTLTQAVSAGDCAVCDGSCGTTGCSYSCASDPSIGCKRYQARFMCNGRIHTACNENNGKSLGSRPDLTDPQYWCKTFQFDSNADNGAYSMVYVGDGGETCTHKGGKPNKCDPDDLDWDCSNEPPPPPPKPENKPPACEYLSINKTTVTSLTEPITISVKGTDPEGTPKRLMIYAAAGNQVNKNPGNFYCTNSDPSHSEYSFYCGGLGSWVLIGSQTNSNVMTMTTNYKELKTMVNSLSSSYQGHLNNKGINITANILGTTDGDICSSNIARNNGKGVYYNNGSWNQACDGGCNVFVKYIAPAKPVEKQCNGTCTQSSQCTGDLICSSGYCRNANCTSETDCTCPKPPAECNNECGKDDECENGLTCYEGQCRNPECKGESDCTCPVPPAQCNESCGKDNTCKNGLACVDGACRNPSCENEPDCTCPANPSEPRCGDLKCNQDAEMCENNVSCSTGAAVSCRTDCTYCGDGVVNGGEECDYNKDGTTNCTKECKWIEEHPPTGTAGFIDDNLAMIGGFGMLAMGVGSVALAAPLKKKVRFE